MGNNNRSMENGSRSCQAELLDPSERPGSCRFVHLVLSSRYPGVSPDR